MTHIPQITDIKFVFHEDIPPCNIEGEDSTYYLYAQAVFVLDDIFIYNGCLIYADTAGEKPKAEVYFAFDKDHNEKLTFIYDFIGDGTSEAIKKQIVEHMHKHRTQWRLSKFKDVVQDAIDNKTRSNGRAEISLTNSSIPSDAKEAFGQWLKERNK